MEKIKDILGIKLGKKESKEIQPKSRGGINSLRADNCWQLMIFMGEDRTLQSERNLENKTPGAGKEAKRVRLSNRMKYWLGRTRKLPAGEIYRLMRAAKDGKNPQALFNHLLKNYGKK